MRLPQKKLFHVKHYGRSIHRRLWIVLLRRLVVPITLRGTLWKMVWITPVENQVADGIAEADEPPIHSADHGQRDEER